VTLDRMLSGAQPHSSQLEIALHDEAAGSSNTDPTAWNSKARRWTC